VVRGARTEESSGAVDGKAKKREEGLGMVYIGLGWRDVVGMGTNLPAKWGRWRERGPAGFEIRISAVSRRGRGRGRRAMCVGRAGEASGGGYGSRRRWPEEL
jgi:hypothetical protein